MKANEVNEVINNICEKIGIGIDNAKEFIPSFAKYQVMHYALWTVVWLAIAILLFVLSKKVMKKYNEVDEWERMDIAFYGVFLIIADLATIGSLTYHLITTIEWMAYPQVMAIKEILSMIQ